MCCEIQSDTIDVGLQQHEALGTSVVDVSPLVTSLRIIDSSHGCKINHILDHPCFLGALERVEFLMGGTFLAPDGYYPPWLEAIIPGE